MSDLDLYAPAPGLCVGVGGARAARAHFAAEYGAARAAGRPEPDVVVTVGFARTLPDGPPRDGHKSVRWSAEVGPPGEHPLRLRLVLAGRPRRFALSLVQGYLVEPLVSVAAAHRGLVLLPAAALVEADGAVVVLGRSGSGKTSVVARAVASGRSALGDDQVVLAADGTVRSWPRRLRVYSDLRLTAPDAVAALPQRAQQALRLRRWVAAATRGGIAPSLPLPWTALGGAAASGPVPVTRLVVVERGGPGGDAVHTAELGLAAVADLARAVLREQRDRFARLAGPAWEAALLEAEQAEQQTLGTALDGLGAERWQLPASWDAARSVGALSSALGVPAG